jgi:hypothetical protein
LFDKNKKEYWVDMDDRFYSCPLSFKNSRSIIKTKFKPNSFTVSNSKVFMNEVDIPNIIPLFITLDNSDIYGKKDASWEIYDDNDKIIHSSKGLMSVYQFRDLGFYSVSLKIVDVNGNIYNIRKNNIINVLNDFEYLKNYKNAKR